jgi:hypothetical protein
VRPDTAGKGQSAPDRTQRKEGDDDRQQHLWAELQAQELYRRTLERGRAKTRKSDRDIDARSEGARPWRPSGRFQTFAATEVISGARFHLTVLVVLLLFSRFSAYP